MSLWGLKDDLASVPKFLSTEDKKHVFFVDETEAKVASNRAKGIKSPGWYLYKGYDDANGNTRHKAELLIPAKVTAAMAGDAGAISVLATAMVVGQTYTILVPGTTNFTLVGAADNNVGTVFTASGPATGTGTVVQNDNATVANS